MKIFVKEQLSPHKYKTPQGYLICTDAILARTGKQMYKKGDFFPDCADSDADYEVDRREEDVFDKAAIASFENMPLTVEHPQENVTVENIKKYAVGYVRDVHKGEFENKPVMMGNLIFTDEAAIQKIENAEMLELSCGYDCEIADSDTDPHQVQIRGNHVALCTQGRAGIAQIQDSAIETSVRDTAKTITVQCYILSEDSMHVLIQDRVGPAWKGLAVPGGHIKVNETPVEACIREVKEETGLTVKDLQLFGTHQYTCEEDGECIALLYRTKSFTGDLHDSNEGKMSWMAYDFVCSCPDCAEGFQALLTKCVNSIQVNDSKAYDSESLEKDIRDILSKYNAETSSKIKLFETKPGTFIEHYDDGDIDFSRFKEHYGSDLRYTFSITGGLNANGEWTEYLEDLTKKFEELESKTGLRVVVQDITTDVADDVWTAKILMYEPSTHDSVKDIDPKEGESKEDFISRFMRETKEEYPDSKQRLAVAYSYWKKAHDSLTCDAKVEDPATLSQIKNMTKVKNKYGVEFVMKDDETCYASQDGQTWYTGKVRVIEEYNAGKTQRHRLFRVALGGGKESTIAYSRLLYGTKVGPISSSMEIDHLDGDHMNDKLSNYEVVSSKENMNRNLARIDARKQQSKNGQVSRKYIEQKYGASTLKALMEHNDVDRFIFNDSVKDAQYPSFLGYINGTMADFSPSEFIDKVKQRKQSLHTNRVSKATDDMYIVYHIVCELLGWTSLDDVKVYIDVIKETWTRKGSDPDKAEHYQFQEKQDRVLMEKCGSDAQKWDKAIKVLENFKSKHIHDSKVIETTQKVSKTLSILAKIRK